MKVAVLMGSPNDQTKMAPATAHARASSASSPTSGSCRPTARRPWWPSSPRTARENGYAAIICGAGMAAHLAGAVAANTTLPVVGVPLSGGALNGVDALYATVQMPRGIPVATVAIDGAMNAALLVVQILAVTDAGLRPTDARRGRPLSQLHRSPTSWRRATPRPRWSTCGRRRTRSCSSAGCGSPCCGPSATSASTCPTG